jgi:hypothetical protein
MLTYSYRHLAGQSNPQPVLSSNPPTDPNNGYSHVNLNSIPGFNNAAFLQAVRFTCTTAAHSRKVNMYYTSNSNANEGVMTGSIASNVVANW